MFTFVSATKVRGILVLKSGAVPQALSVLSGTYPFRGIPLMRYTLADAPQQQNFTDENLALHVVMVISARC